MNFCLWPYEELTLQQTESGSVRLATPWKIGDITLTEEEIEALNRSSSIPMNDQRELWTRTFNSMRNDPFFYLLPRPISQFPTGNVQCIETRSSPAVSFVAQKFESEAVREKMQQRDWDVGAVLELARIAGTELFDPVTLFTAFRRFYYLDALEFDRTVEMYRRLKSFKKNPRLFAMASYLVGFQNLEVTRRCDGVLKPALELLGDGREVLEDFMAAESGHDELLGRALERFDLENKEEVSRVLPLTNLLMDHFQYIAGSNPLAFAFTVALFEEDPQDGRDPLSETLASGGQTEAARGFALHHEINEKGGHDAIGLRLSSALPPIDEKGARQAAELAEAMSKIFNLYTAGLISEFERLATVSSSV